ncbi:DUF5959 family protein [Nocardiopsis sp. M1B1]|uniref:DUF5959 family protein n=1 Tax=Nocardiopsis sp. M1B1 TaxID=3450454 RepID=UPI00403A6454
MTDDVRPLPLLRIADRWQSVSVRVLGTPVTPSGGRHHEAEIVVESDFVSGRVGLVVSPGDLDAWERCLNALAAEERAEWPSGGRTAWLDIVPDDPVEVTVRDSPSTQVSVRLPIDVPEGWLEENRALLAHVRRFLDQASPSQPPSTGCGQFR